MLGFKVTHNIGEVAKAFDKMSRGQIQFATSIAINRTAEFARDALKSNMGVVFDRPKPFVINSLFIKRATKSKLTATVFHSDKVSPYLKAEIEGGSRNEKRFELKIGNDILVPTRHVPKDQYGGVSRAYIRKVLGQAYPLRARERYVIVKDKGRGKLEPGIYERMKDGKIRALFLIKPQAIYQPRYDMQAVVQRTVQSQFGAQFNAAMDFALSTAKIKLRK
jgi:hypothetical protein